MNKKSQTFLYAIILISIILFSSYLIFVKADGPPAFEQFYGKVYINNVLAPNTLVEAKINGIVYTSVTSNGSGYYGYSPNTFFVNGNGGDVISFYVNNNFVLSRVISPFGLTELDLYSITQPTSNSITITLGGIRFNNTITISDNSSYDYMMNNGNYKVYFKNNSKDSKAVKFIKEGYTFEFDISTSQVKWYNSSLGAEIGMVQEMNPQDNNIIPLENEGLYNNAWINTNLSYSLYDNQIKEILTIANISPKSSSIYADYLQYRSNNYFNNSLKVCYINGTQEICQLHPTNWKFNTQGEIYYKDSNNKTIFYHPAPRVWDASGNEANATYSATANNGIMLLSIRIPTSFINNIVYPLYVDPTILTLAVGDNLEDISFGTEGPSKGYVIYSKWNITKIPAGVIIDDAIYCAYTTEYLGDNDGRSYYISNQSWTEAISVGELPLASADQTAFLWNSTTTNTWTCANVTIPLRTSYANGDINFSLYLDDPDYPLDTSSILIHGDTGQMYYGYWDGMNVFHSRSGANPPYLSITYTIPFAGENITPLIQITYPIATNYNYNVSNLNYTYYDLNPDSCWYSTNGGTTNSTPVTAGTNFTNVVSVEGTNTWYLYCNDTSNNIVYDYVIFFRDTIYPNIFFTDPTLANNSQKNYTALINISINDTNLKEFIYAWNGTNFTYYSPDLFLMMNFDNVSEIGENLTQVKDVSIYNMTGLFVGNTKYRPSSIGQGMSLFFDGTGDWVNISKNKVNDILSHKTTFDTTPTFDGSNQSVHPDIVYFPNTWKGYKYWMVNTPYPAGNDDYENPSILVCNITCTNYSANWINISTNPINSSPYMAGGHYNDPDMVYVPDKNALYVWWLDGGSGITRVLFSNSTNGTGWSAQRNIFNVTDFQIISPAFEYQGGQFKMWATNYSSNLTTYWNSSDGLTWTEQNNTINILPAGYKPWHLNVKWIPEKNEYWMVTGAYTGASIVGLGRFYFANSNDGVTWTNYSRPIFIMSGTSWDSTSIHRPYISYNSASDEVQMWYSALQTSTYHIGYSNITYTAMMNHLNRRTSVFFNPSQGTMCVWFNTTVAETTGVMGDRNSASDTNWFEINVGSDNTIRAGCKNATIETDLNLGSLYTITNWTHICVAWNSTGFYKYINGTLDQQNLTASCTTVTESNFAIAIGNYYDFGSTRDFNGQIDEPRIWNRSLTPDEIFSVYSSRFTKSNVSQYYFYINQSKNSTSFLTPANYTYQGFAYDIANNFNLTDLRTIVIGPEGGTDTTYPNFVNVLNLTRMWNTTIEEDLNATDDTAFDCFKVNDTRFTINCSGWLTNASLLKSDFYLLNITINDSTNNKNYTLMYVNITKAPSLVYAYINGTRANFTANYLGGKNIWLNGTAEANVSGNIYTLLANSIISNGASPRVNLTNLSMGFYNFTAVYDGNENTTASQEVWWINITENFIPNCTIITQAGYYKMNNSISNAIIPINQACIEIKADNVNFECDGNIIDGLDAVSTYGIRVFNTTTRKVTNVTINNCTLTDWGLSTYFNYVNNSKMANTTIFSSYTGFLIINSINNTFNSINQSGAIPYAMQLFSSSLNKITNSIFDKNNRDIDYISASATNCNNIFDNANGTDNKPIVLYNNTIANIQHWNSNFSEIILCNADRSILNNVTSNLSYRNVPIQMILSDFVNISSLNITNTNTALEIFNSLYTRINNSNVSNSNVGIRVDQSLHLIITNNRIVNNIDGLGINRNNNTLYNNYFNNTRNAYFITGALATNYWNKTKELKTNIAGGINIGGNFWATPGGTGFSQTCADSDGDAICDSVYILSGTTNRDYLPLAIPDNTDPTVVIISPINNTYVNGNVTLKAQATDNIGIRNVTFFYKNSTVGWTFLCYNSTPSVNIFSCKWDTALFNNNSEGYDINATAYDYTGNKDDDMKHYIIDRTKPVIDFLWLIYPTGQTSVRNNQNITLKANVTDSPYIASGLNFTKVDVTNINNSNSNTSMVFELGSLNSDSYSLWNLTLNVSGSTGLQTARFYVYDNATPTNNLRDSDAFLVQVDNDPPTYANLNHTPQTIWNNTDVTFLLDVYDNYQLEKYIFSTNMTGAWVNDTEVSISGTAYAINHIKRVYTGSFGYGFFIFDDAGNMNQTFTAVYEVAGQRPDFVVYLNNSPINNYYYNISTVNLTFWYENGNATNCSLFIDGILNSTINDYPPSSTILGLQNQYADGEYTWYYNCYNVDTATDSDSEQRTFTIDTIYPILNITYPRATAIYTQHQTQLNYTINELNQHNCWYSLNNGTTNTSMTCGVNVTGIGSTGGTNVWFVWANDSAGNINSSYVIFIVNVTPEINLIYPALQQNITTREVIFVYNISSADDVANCSLIINGTIDQTDNTIIRDIEQAFTKSLNYQSYNWSVNCTTINNAFANSTIWEFSIRPISEGGLGDGGSGSQLVEGPGISSGNHTTITVEEERKKEEKIPKFIRDIRDIFLWLGGLISPSKPSLGIGIFLILFCLLLIILIKRKDIQKEVKKWQKKEYQPI